MNKEVLEKEFERVFGQPAIVQIVRDPDNPQEDGIYARVYEFRWGDLMVVRAEDCVEFLRSCIAFAVDDEKAKQVKEDMLLSGCLVGTFEGVGLYV